VSWVSPSFWLALRETERPGLKLASAVIALSALGRFSRIRSVFSCGTLTTICDPVLGSSIWRDGEHL